MIHKKVLIVATYPIKVPQNGGQKRARAIFNLYKNIFEEAKFVGVFHRGSYNQYARSDITLGEPGLIRQVERTPYFGDIIAGRAIADDIHVRSAMAKLLMEYQPDVVQVEQIFPYFGLESLMKDIDLWPKVIYSSHNVEYQMKDDIYRMLGVEKEERSRVVDQIRMLEKKISKRADLTVAVSRDDAKKLAKMGAKKIFIAPNGIDKNKPTSDAVKYWKEYKRKHKINNLITFIASGHPPNWQGFQEMIGDDLSFLPDGADIVLAGSISGYAKNIKTPSDTQNKDFWKHVKEVGVLSEDKLAGLTVSSDIILLPITTGGGSNLKTAEALLAGKKVVATNYAFRSYEKYKTLPNIFIADSSKDFQTLIRKTLRSSLIPFTPNQRRLVEKVRWKHTLSELSSAVASASEDTLSSRLRRTVQVQTYKYERILKSIIVSVMRKFGYR